MSTPLDNLHILVTRPKHQSTQIKQQLHQLGAMVSCLPLIEIAPPVDPAQTRITLQQIDKYDNVIFISHNAVVWALQLGGMAFREQLASCRVGAIGNKTALTLRQSGVGVDDVPESGFNSEAFLSLVAMQCSSVEDRKVLIVRGEGGRELLARVLLQRGAQPEYVDVYRRALPPPDMALPVLQRQVQLPLDMIAITSGEGLHNLLRLLGKSGWIKTTPLLVGSERIAREARLAGFEAELIVADDPGDDAMLKALLCWRQGSKDDRQI